MIKKFSEKELKELKQDIERVKYSTYDLQIDIKELLKRLEKLQIVIS